jgi:hypothetical protein
VSLFTELLARNQSADWGEVNGEDWRLNQRALTRDERLLSSYDTPCGKVWIITEANKRSTTVLLPSEY